MDCHVVEGSHKFALELSQLGICGALSIGCLGLLVVAEMLFLLIGKDLCFLTSVLSDSLCNKVILRKVINKIWRTEI